MRKSHWVLLLGSTLALGALAVACGDDDSGNNPTVDGGGTEGGPITNPEAGPIPEGGPGVDGGCTFASYVIDLVNTKTTASALPDPTLGASCTPSTTQAEFKSLFP